MDEVIKLPDDECAICGKKLFEHNMNGGVGMCRIYPTFVSKRQMFDRIKDQSHD